MEQHELNRFYTELLQDIRSEQLSNEEGGSLEQLFTTHAIALLTEGGETADVRISFHESIIPRNRHKINAYAIADNYETLDLFVTVFKCTEKPSRIQKSDIDNAAKLLLSFLKKADNREYSSSLEESSEIFDFAHTLNASAELRENLVRINIYILTDGIYNGEIPSQKELNEIPVFFRVIGLNYLFNISEKEYVPIEIDFEEDGFEVPCIKADIDNPEYQSYLALIPGHALVSVYEQYGARLLEQNVRSFLQFTGKINKGIRNTILKEPHMFLAFNNGIAATADDLKLKKTEKGYLIESVKDLQIVNGGQTTASIYHTWKKDKADIKDIVIQVKLSIIKDKNNFSEIVSRIAEYANTQNKVSISDLSSNTPFHIELEKLSRNIWAPPVSGQSHQTRWFYERARGQYRNARSREGTTKTKLKAFDLKNPKKQLFTKEELAKFINTWNEVYQKDTLVIGPHIVVRGSQKNYAQFIMHNIPENLENKYFEETIAKAILFRTAEKLYGRKPSSIGDMRFITVPYALTLLSLKNRNSIDLNEIWKKQTIPDTLQDSIYNLMTQVEQFIKQNAPGALYGEWAKKEDCWIAVKENLNVV
ncbi:AIPR protein [Arcticibacter tournemirensis]|uniref:AIPR family protein n=1 Tax=Arcticibacter tournemirensis TaxID=699437 RepID=A0A5M9GV84_9SPHI|nr:AIPR family protein [Arcticibacter tournemirensis]KAA8478220.1 AIPR family protein [Arcticibacter tournemirensis]TQM50755.1 AIPR protein [Arcticibacter tournemirensis]